jgi:hypothetical protein
LINDPAQSKFALGEKNRRLNHQAETSAAISSSEVRRRMEFGCGTDATGTSWSTHFVSNSPFAKL